MNARPRRDVVMAPPALRRIAGGQPTMFADSQGDPVLVQVGPEHVPDSQVQRDAARHGVPVLVLNDEMVRVLTSVDGGGAIERQATVLRAVLSGLSAEGEPAGETYLLRVPRASELKVRMP